MSRDDDLPDHQWRNRMSEIEEELDYAIQLYRSELLDPRYPGITEDTQQTLATRVLWFYDALKKYSDESSISVSWNEHNLDRLDDLAHEHIDVPSNKAGYGNASETIEKSALLMVDARTLKQWADLLRSLSKDLGFAAKTATQTAPTDENIVDPRGEERT